MNAILNAVVKLFIRLFLPGIARSLAEENQFDFRDKASGPNGADASLALAVEDNGADTTVICFAGMAVLYAAMPKFEFRKVLAQTGGRYNFIWVRDVHRASYNVGADGGPDGFAYYTRIIGDAIATLESTCNIAIGASGGAAAAFGFSGSLPIHLVVAFNPAFPLKDYASPQNKRRVLLDWRKLLRSPGDYFETLLVTLSAQYLWRRNCRLVGEENIPGTLECYLRKDPPAEATVIYSVHCPPDAAQALALKGIPTITLRPVESGRHNCMGELKKRGELSTLIQKEIDAGLARLPK